MTTHKHHFIAIAGNIGAGKSTLTRMLAAHFGWQPFYEANADNPYLPDFYADMPRWSFHSQVFFLSKRLEHHRQLVDFAGHVVQDRTVYEDAEVFAQNLYLQGKMPERDYRTYRRLYESISAFLPAPTLVIYLQATVETLMALIKGRGRDYEKNIGRDYIDGLNLLYDAWIDRWTASPVLRIQMDIVDFVNNPKDFRNIVNEITTILG
ncbi:MAG: deoxynucleoside kinase [Phototrophicales bacterium]|nr:MAG: deoxynucleoside kinase [Phototrophicales bacterium]